MKNTKKRNEVKIESREDFFARGKHIGKMLDKGEKIPPSRIISFEDQEDLRCFLINFRYK